MLATDNHLFLVDNVIRASRGPVLTPFSGCIQSFQHNLATSVNIALTPDDLITGINSSAAVDTSMCLSNVSFKILQP